MEHRQTEGAVAELQAHCKIGPNQVPLALMRVEERALTPAPTNTGANEQPVVSAVFANSVASWLSVDQPTVGLGMRSIRSLLADLPSAGRTPTTPLLTRRQGRLRRNC